MRGSQVFGLAVGWLAVALSMAAIGTASLARVGLSTSGPQAQITVSRSTSAGQSDSVLAPASGDWITISARTQADVGTVSLVELTTPVTPARTTVAAAGSMASSAEPQPSPPSDTPTAPVVKAPVVKAPLVEAPVVVIPDNDALDTADGVQPMKPATTKLSQDLTPNHPSDGTATKASDSLLVATESFSTVRLSEGAIRAGCNETALTFVEPKPSDDYQSTQRTSGSRTSVTFDGPTELTVWVSCSDGKPSFSILH